VLVTPVQCLAIYVNGVLKEVFPHDPDACPACEARLVTGQGVYACRNCEWVGTATGTDQYRPLARARRERTPDEDSRTLDLRR